MSDFWKGFSDVLVSRFACDVWMLFVGFSLGVHVVRGQYINAVIFGTMAVLWIRFSHKRDGAERRIAYLRGKLDAMNAQGETLRALLAKAKGGAE